MRFTFRLARNEQLLLLGVLLAIAAFWGGLSELVGRWYNQEEYSHGFFLPLISLFLLWYRRDVLKKSRGAPSAWGLVLLLVAALLLFAAAQVVVHMVYFLHMNAKSEGGWNALALIFTVVLVVIVLAGSLWVMHHLNTNMMPMSPHEARIQP